MDQDVTVARIEGRLAAMGEVLPGAVVFGTDRNGKLVGRTLSGADGKYSLAVSAMPYRIAVKAAHRVPRVVVQPALKKVATGKYAWSLDAGPFLGGDGTSENLVYLVTDAASSPRLVPAVAWGDGGGLGSPFDEMRDLTVGPRATRLTSLLPFATRVVPNAAECVERKVAHGGDYLEARFSEELNTQQYGSQYEALLIEQIVATASINSGPERLPVRIRVRCATCTGGYTDLNDAHVGPTELGYPLRTAAPEDAFSDLRGQRYARHVAMAKGMGWLANFSSDGTFRPGAPATRAEVAALLVRALGVPLVTPATPSYRDVKKSDWFYAAVETARARGFMSGNADFRPAASVTRAELAAYAGNAARWPAQDPSRATFTDVPRSYWAFSRVETAYGFCHAVEPRAAGTFRFEPAAAATRAEAAAAMVRMLNCLLE